MFRVICYDREKTYDDSERKQVIDEFVDNYMNSEGHEKLRYASVLFGLINDDKVADDIKADELSMNVLDSINKFCNNRYVQLNTFSLDKIIDMLNEGLYKSYPNVDYNIVNNVTEDIVEILQKTGKMQPILNGTFVSKDIKTDTFYIEKAMLDFITKGDEYICGLIDIDIKKIFEDNKAKFETDTLDDRVG